MKRITLLLLLCVFLSSCAAQQTSEVSPATPVVLASKTPTQAPTKEPTNTPDPLLAGAPDKKVLTAAFMVDKGI